jgi:hypothetical protein
VRGPSPLLSAETPTTIAAYNRATNGCRARGNLYDLERNGHHSLQGSALIA